MIETEFTAVDIRCPKCQSSWEAPVARMVNAGTHPDARLGILIGTMHRTRCPLCHWTTRVDAIFDYYDPDRELVIQWRPDWEIRAGGGEEWYWKRYEDLVLKYADKPVRVDVVFGFDEMIEKYLGGQAAVEEAQQQWEARRAPAAASARRDGPAESASEPDSRDSQA